MYFVEGECEKKLIKAYMNLDETCFHLGKVEVFNMFNERMSNAYARTIKKKTKIIIILDSDVPNVELLDENLKTIKKVTNITDEDIIILFSIRTFEDELIYSCSKLTNIHSLFNTKGIDEFKKKFIGRENIQSKLKEVNFHIEKMWSRSTKSLLEKYNKFKRSIIDK